MTTLRFWIKFWFVWKFFFQKRSFYIVERFWNTWTELLMLIKWDKLLGKTFCLSDKAIKVKMRMRGFWMTALNWMKQVDKHWEVNKVCRPGRFCKLPFNLHHLWLPLLSCLPSDIPLYLMLDMLLFTSIIIVLFFISTNKQR